ncbi:hypothetical protein Gotri_006988 [Gossypium trilobum]|uniref:Uncharacterized protein n=1 Tax=Gossypium trilobum TaxID=34281 RepID=A0A7J9EF74_9ROSI|nr:hypothetical protein [Gossypium trilobum]
MHSPYSTGPPPNRRLVGCIAITGRISSVPITPIGCNRHSPHSAPIRDSLPFLIFYSIFCPHRFLLLLPSILQR